MTQDPIQHGLSTPLARLREAGVVPAVAEPLQRDRDSALESLMDAVAGAVPAYRESANPDVLPALREHLGEHLDQVCRLLAGGAANEFDHVRDHAGQRAAQKFPLEAILQSYQCLQRFMTDRVRDAALKVADDSAHVRRVVAAASEFVAEYVGAVSSVVTSAYVDQTRRIAEAEGDRRTELLNTLLDGYDESDQRAARRLRRAGYLQQRMSYCVAVARAVNAEEMQSPARAQRMADAVGAALGTMPVRTLVGIRDSQVIAIISATRRLSGWTAPQSALAERVYPALRKVGPAALIGLSNDVPSTSHIPRAVREARFALELANVADRVVAVARVPFQRMLVASAGEDIRHALPAWLDDFLAVDRRSRGKLSDTLRAYADCDMNVLRTAKSLGIHPNTIYARMRRINDATGMNASSYHALTEILLVMEASAST